MSHAEAGSPAEGRIAAAFEAELRKVERDRDNLEATLLEVAAALAEDDPDEVIRRLVNAARIAVDAAIGIFVDLQSDSRVVVTADETSVGDHPEPAAAPLLAGALGGAEILSIDDVTRWARSDGAQRPYGSLDDGRLLRSWIVIPTVVDDSDTRGLLLGHPDPGRFGPRQVRLATGLGAQLAAAFKRMAEQRERVRVGAVLQETLLPPLLPDVPGVELAARYQASGAGNLVGGDFYDVFPVEGGSWGALLGDVSGFGPEAAAITGQARYTVRAVSRSAESPSSVLRQLNDAIGGRSDDRFCSAIYLLLRPEAAGLAMTIARGGHPPPIVLRDDGSVEILDDGGGMLLGLFPDPELVDLRVGLRTGDAMVLYTDGVIEARNSLGDQLGIEGLANVVASCAGRTADGISRRIELAALDWQDGQAQDDVAIVVLRVRPLVG